MKLESTNSETLGYSGLVTITKISSSGEKEVYEFKNRVVDSGLQVLMNRFLTCTGSAPTDMIIGTGTVPVTSLDVSLTSLASSATPITSTILGNTIEFQGSWPAGLGTGAITEAGIMCGGALFARTVFPVVNKLPLDELFISWVITFAAV